MSVYFITYRSCMACDARYQLKDGEQWRTINGAHVLIDKNGTIIGGANGKLNGINFYNNAVFREGRDLGETDVSDADFDYWGQGLNGMTHGDLLSKQIDRHGKLRRSRETLHKRLVLKRFNGVRKPKEGEPRVMTFLGGGTAVGKSTFTKSEGSGFPTRQDAVFIDSDEIKGEIPEYKKMVAEGKTEGAAGFAHEESSAIGKRAMKVAQDDGFNVVLDGTGDGGLNSMKKKIAQARAAGMRVEGVYCTCSIEEALKRAIARGKKTGRDVNPNVVRNIHRNVSIIFPQIIKDFDKLDLYDTSTRKPIHILHYERGGEIQIKNKKLYDEFLAKAN